MSFHLTPSFHNNWFPFGSSNNDMRMLRRMMDMTDSESGPTSTVEPSYTFESDEKGAHFEIEMPGVSKENISIEAAGHKLIVKGKRFQKHLIAHHDTVVEEEGENGTGTTEHTVKKTEPVPSIVYVLEARLAHGADLDAIKADHCGDGILTVTVPVKVDKGARRIQIGL